jgi:hypothetical protein
MSIPEAAPPGLDDVAASEPPLPVFVCQECSRARFMDIATFSFPETCFMHLDRYLPRVDLATRRSALRARPPTLAPALAINHSGRFLNGCDLGLRLLVNLTPSIVENHCHPSIQVHVLIPLHVCFWNQTPRIPPRHHDLSSLASNRELGAVFDAHMMAEEVPADRADIEQKRRRYANDLPSRRMLSGSASRTDLENEGEELQRLVAIPPRRPGQQRPARVSSQSQVWPLTILH